jgi:hypothetical protein
MVGFIFFSPFGDGGYINTSPFIINNALGGGGNTIFNMPISNLNLKNLSKNKKKNLNLNILIIEVYRDRIFFG